MGQVLKGSISGTVVDPQGAVVPGAHIKATHTATGGVATTTSDSVGVFHFNLIAVGDYKIEVSAQGFKTAQQGAILVAAGRDTGLGSIQLTVGEATTTVEVTAAIPLIEATQSQVTNTFSTETLTTFAGIQENQGLDNLALFVPGVSSTRDTTFSNTNGTGFAVNGLRGRNNDQQIDGQNNNDNSVGGPGLFVTDEEFAQQYVLITNQFGPEYGRNAGSVVNIITKSGSNAWHGSIYETENNSDLNAFSNDQKRFATNPDGSPLSKLPRSNDEFGGFTVGGPILKNKAFVFGGFDQEIISANSIDFSDNLTPTPNGLTQLAACPGVDPSALAALSKFGPWGISAGSPIALKDPNTGTFTTLNILGCNIEFGGVSRTVSTPVHNFNWVMKSDLQLGRDSITGRYILNRGNSFNNSDNGAAGYFFNVPALSQSALLSWTHNFGSRMVNEARLSFGRLNVEFGGNSFGTEVNDGNLLNGVTSVNFLSGGLLGYGPNAGLPQGRIVNTWQAQDNWNLVVGKHQLKAGVNWTYQRSPNIFLPFINGGFFFNDWAGYLTNTPAFDLIADGTPTLDFREYDTFIYGGDDWKVTRNLTLNLGLTWSYYGQPANLMHTLDVARESNPSTAFWDPTLPLADRTFPQLNSIKNTFGPSVGFAYSPQWGGFLTGHGKTVIRGGFRMLYDPPFYNIYLNVADSAPQVFLTAAFGPLPAVPTGPNVRAALAPFITTGVIDPRTQGEETILPSFGPDHVKTWTLGIERQLTKNSALEARYVGNRGSNLFQFVNANPFVADLAANFPNLLPAGVTPCANPTALGFGRVNCNEGLLSQVQNTGYSDYNGLQLEYRANNLFKQLTMRMAYSYSKTTDNVSEIFGTGGAGNTLAVSQNPLNFTTAEHSLSGLDFPQQWTILLTEQLPFFKQQHGFVGHVFGGWAVAANYILSSGQGYTPAQRQFATATSANYYDTAFWQTFVGEETARPFVGNLNAPATSVGIFAGDACLLLGVGCSSLPNQLISLNSANSSGTAVAVTQNQVRFIANTGIAQQTFGTPFGNAPRNVVRDAMTNIGNLSIYKSVKLGEHTAFEFHATMLNAFNHFNFGSVDPFVEDAGFNTSGNGFGDPKLTNAGGRRIIFGGRLTF